MLIYKITNLINGKMYVGKTKRTLAVRFDEHARKGKFLIGKAICKYGKENFRPEIIATCETVEEANGLEKYWIKTLNCKVPNGYNLTDGGDGGENRVISKSTRRKMSVSAKKRWSDPVKRRQATEANRRRWEDPEFHAKMSNIQKKRCVDKPDSEETRTKKSVSHIGKKHSQTTKNKISVSNTGKIFSEEHRANLSASSKARWDKIRAQREQEDNA